MFFESTQFYKYCSRPHIWHLSFTLLPMFNLRTYSSKYGISWIRYVEPEDECIFVFSYFLFIIFLCDVFLLLVEYVNEAVFDGESEILMLFLDVSHFILFVLFRFLIVFFFFFIFIPTLWDLLWNGPVKEVKWPDEPDNDKSKGLDEPKDDDDDD